jgi:hypothetical protein
MSKGSTALPGIKTRQQKRLEERTMKVRKSPRARLWVLLVFAVALATGGAYEGTYYYLSRRGMQEAKALDIKGFLYIPAQEATDEEALARHYALARFYWPANTLDQALTGADEPVRCILFHLSK